MNWRQLIRLVELASRTATGAAFLVLLAAVVIQVTGRIAGDSPVWTEELTRFALLFLTAFGAGLSFRTGDLVNVDILCESLPAPLPRILRLVSSVATAVLCVVLIGPAMTFASIGALQTSPALGWRMDFILVSILILLVLLAIFATVRFFDVLRDWRGGTPAKNPEA